MRGLVRYDPGRTYIESAQPARKLCAIILLLGDRESGDGNARGEFLAGAALACGRGGLSVVLALAGCDTALSGESHAAAPQPLSRPESAYPVTPFARIETGTHVAMVNRIDVDAAERVLVSASEDETVRVWDRLFVPPHHP